jgi:hypothetical protein
MSTALWVGPLADMVLTVEFAFGADLTDTDGSGWVWTDVTSSVRQDPGISTRLGRGDEAARSQPAEITFSLDNSEGDFSIGGASRYYPYVRQGTPVRVTIDPDDAGGERVVFMGFATAWTPRWDALGKIAIVTLGASGILRRLAQGASPLPSPFRRAMTALSTVVAYWPFEEGDEATYGAVVRGGSNFIYSGKPDFGSDNDFVASGPLPRAGTGAFLATVDPYTATGLQQVRLLIDMPEGGIPDGTVLAHVYTTGTLGRFDVTYELSPGPCLGWFAYNADGTLALSSINGEPSLNGLQGRLSIEISQVGSNVQWGTAIIDQDPGSPIIGHATDVIGSRTCGIIKQIELFPHGDGVQVGFGHVTVENTLTSLFADHPSLQAFYGEYPSSSTVGISRLHRLCAENGLDLIRYTSTTVADNLAVREQMSYQPKATLLTALVECEDTDFGQLWDGRTAGLIYTTRRYREQGTVALTLRAGLSKHLADPFEPTADDQRTTNRAEVTRVGGVVSTYSDDTGPMGTAAIGVYDTAKTISSTTDSMARQQAGWIVNLGTFEGYRYPSVTIDLRQAPELAGDVLDLVPGDRISITDPDQVLAEFPVGTLELIVEGISHEMNAAGWICTLRCSPGSPWFVAQASATTSDTNEFLFRADTSGSTLNGNAAHSVTSISVATTTGPIWTTAADDFPMNLSVGGIKVVATACSGTSSPQTFTIQPLSIDRTSGMAVELWDQRPIGL